MRHETRIKVITKYVDGKEAETKYVPQYCIPILGFYREWATIRESITEPKEERETLTQAQEAILNFLQKQSDSQRSEEAKKRTSQKVRYVKYP